MVSVVVVMLSPLAPRVVIPQDSFLFLRCGILEDALFISSKDHSGCKDELRMPGPPKENMHDRGRPSHTHQTCIIHLCGGNDWCCLSECVRREREKRKKEES